MATAATKIISQSQNFTAEELANNANVLANAKGLQKVAERVGVVTKTLSKVSTIAPLDIIALKNKKAKIDANKNLQTFRPTADDIKLLDEAKTQCDKFINHYSLQPKTAENQANLKIATKMRLDYNRLSQNFDNCQAISPATEEALSITVNMAAKNRLDNKKLTEAEKLIVNDFRENLQSLANAQQNGRFPKHEIRQNLTAEEMTAICGNNFAANIVAALVFVGDVPTIAISKNSPNINSTIVHETQHLIQYQKGELAYKDGQVLSWTYDIHDEIEAYKMQYLAAPDSMPNPVGKISDINEAYLRAMYPNLPSVPLSINSTLEEIQNAMVNAGNEASAPKLTLSNTEDNAVPWFIWDDIKDIKLKDFLVRDDDWSLQVLRNLNISFSK